MSAATYALAVQQVRQAIQGTPGVAACEATQHLRHKVDFGDVDLVVSAQSQACLARVGAALSSAMGAVARSGCNFAVPLQAPAAPLGAAAPSRLVQVDASLTTPSDFRHLLAYKSYSCFGALLGVALLREGLVFSMAGLEVPLIPDDKHSDTVHGALRRGRLLLSNDFDTIAAFLQLDVNTFWAGFDDTPALLAFMCQSPYVHPAAIRSRRVRNGDLRLGAPLLLAALDTLAASRPPHQARSRAARHAALTHFDAHASVDARVATLLQAAGLAERSRARLNGHLLQQWTGIAPGPRTKTVLRVAVATLESATGLVGHAAVCASSDASIEGAVRAAGACVEQDAEALRLIAPSPV